MPTRTPSHVTTTQRLLLGAIVVTVACDRDGTPPPPTPPPLAHDGGDTSDPPPSRDAALEVALDSGRHQDGDRDASGDGDVGTARETMSPLDSVRAAAAVMLTEERSVRWGRAARLGPEELTCEYATLGEHGLEVFSVLDADGFEGHYKCNLFAFELLYRAGLVVPVISRVRGWTFPGPLCVTRMVEGESGHGGWASPVDALSAEELSAASSSGRVFMVAGSGTRGRHGHLGVVEDVHALERDHLGRIVSFDYTGWEANADRARRRRRTWESARFGRIHVIELHPPAAGSRQIEAAGPPPDEPSVADRSRLSDSALAAAADNPRRGDMGAWPGGTRIPEFGPPRLPVVHRILGNDSVFGTVLDVDRVVAGDGEAAADAVSRTRIKGRPGIDVGRVLEAGGGTP